MTTSLLYEIEYDLLAKDFGYRSYQQCPPDVKEVIRAQYDEDRL